MKQRCSPAIHLALSFSVLLVAFAGEVNSFGGNLFPLPSRGKLQVAATQSKEALLNALDDVYGFNRATKERTRLVKELTLDNPTPSPGSTQSFTPFAEGTWKIIYAPHISTMGKFAQGSFDPVVYILQSDGSMISHARYDFPLIGSGWLSVSGTYSSEDEKTTCRVDFDKAWVTILSQHDDRTGPIPNFDSVPSSAGKEVIRFLGCLFFIEQVSVFPVSYLDKDTIVFDFELLGTRICARKVGAPQSGYNYEMKP